MKPAATVVDFGTTDPDPSFTEYEHDSYTDSYTTTSHHHWSSRDRDEEQLPLYTNAMTEEKARRRVKGPAHSAGGGAEEYDRGPVLEKEAYGEYYDDEGKDVYNKIRPAAARLGSGRLPQPPLPPPTSLVCVLLPFPLACPS